MTSEKLPHLGKPQVQQLNEKYGYFEYRDAQGDVSAAFANEAVAEYLRVNEEAQAVMAECGLSPRELLEGYRELRKQLDEMSDLAIKVDGWQSFPQDPIDSARAALAKHKEV